MYIKYRIGSGSYEVRDIRYFTIRAETCELENGSEVEGASICDGAAKRAADFGDLAIQAHASYFAGKNTVRPNSEKRADVIWLDEDWADESFLAWFQSKVAAQKVLDEICKALENGKQFFDLTKYDESGNLRQNN